jgi:hypothetical protein
VTLPPWQNVVGPPAAIAGVAGFAFTATFVLPDAEQPFEAAVMPSDTFVPADVKVIVFVPLPPVIVPPLIDQLYVPPLIAATEAVPVDPLQMALGAVIVAFGSALTVTVVEPPALQPFDVTVTPSDTVPEAEVKVIAFVPLPDVIVPFVIVQEYEAPAIAATEAEPLAPLQIALGAVIVAFGRALTFTVELALPLQLLLVTATPRVTGPELDVNVIALVPAPLVIVPLAIVQAYVAPLTAPVDALPVAPVQIAAGDVIDGEGLLLTVTFVEEDAMQL